MRTLVLASKDLKQIIRDRKSALFLIVMPILFTTFFGFAFRGSQEARLPVGWLNRDEGGALSLSLYNLLAPSDSIELMPMEEVDLASAETKVRDGKWVAVVIVPKGFSGAVFSDHIEPLTVITLPGAPASETAITAVQAALKRVLGTLEVAHLSQETFILKQSFKDEATRDIFWEESLVLANEAWEQPPFRISMEQAIGSIRHDVIASGYVQASPGMIVQFAVFSLITSAMVVVLERKTTALQRMLTTPISRVEIIAGHLLAMFTIVFIQETLLIALGQWIFGVDYLREPIATLLMMAALALWASSLGLLIGAIAHAETQVILFTLVAMFLFAAMGGAWFPLETAGEAFSSFGGYLPSAWAMEGFQNIVLRGQALSSALLPAGILLIFSVGFLGISLWRFQFE